MDMPPDLYNRLMEHLLQSYEGLFLAEEVKNIFGASARKRAGMEEGN